MGNIQNSLERKTSEQRTPKQNSSVMGEVYDSLSTILGIAFKGIPADLTEKEINIKYEGDDKMIQVFLSNTGLEVYETSDSKIKGFKVKKEGKGWKGCILKRDENTNDWSDDYKVIEELTRLIEFVYKNANQCKVTEKNVKSHFGEAYKEMVQELRLRFGEKIPGDLTDKYVTIGYSPKEGLYQSIFLFDNGLEVRKINGESIKIYKTNDERKCISSPAFGEHGEKEIDPSKLYNSIKKFLENNDKCEVSVINLVDKGQKGNSTINEPNMSDDENAYSINNYGELVKNS